MENKNHIDRIGKRKDEEIFSKTPENYFEDLPAEIKYKINLNSSLNYHLYQKKHLRSWGTLVGIASVLLLLVYFNDFKTTQTNEVTTNVTYEEFLENELMNTIDINTDYEILNVNDETKTEIISDKIPAQILENYLMEEDEDIILYN